MAVYLPKLARALAARRRVRPSRDTSVVCRGVDARTRSRMPFAHASEYEPRPCMSTEPTTYAMVVARHDERIDWLFYYTEHFSLTAFVYMASQKHSGPDHGQPALQRPPSAPARISLP